MMFHMRIEIYSDVVCPWCYIGKRRLDAALKTDAGQGVTLLWRPYPLHPNLPAAGLDREEYLARRHGANADRARAPPRIVAEGEDAGIRFNFAAIRRMPNTLAAHRLLDHAATAGDQHGLAETLFRFHFCEGRDLSDTDTLCEAAGEAGLDADGARAWLAGDGGVANVYRQVQEALAHGVAGVPGYLLGGRFLLPGAQSADTMAQFIARAKRKLAADAAD